MDRDGAGIGRRPVPTATASRVVTLFGSQQAALRKLMSGMDADARWVLLLGPDGSGKSTVVQALLAELRLAAATVAVVDARATGDMADLAAALRRQLGLRQKRKLLGDTHAVSDIILGQAARGTPLVVVVDDADALSAAGVKWLARLAASALPADSACYVVLAGTPELEDVAGPAWARRKSDRSVVRCVLEPMASAEVRRYVEQWRGRGGDAGAKFSETAIQRIETYADGRPGLIRELCARACALPSSRLADHVPGDAVVEAAERLGLTGARDVSSGREIEVDRGRRRRIAGRVALVIGLATAGALLVYLNLTLVTPALIAATSTASLGAPAAHRSTSDVVRGPKQEARREPGVTAGAAPAATPSTPPATRPAGGRRAAETPPRAVAAEPSAQQVAALMARAREGEIGELTRLVSAGVSPNVRDVGGFTPLMAAVVNDQVPAARVLLDRGAEINARARGGLTALMLAVINDRPEAVRLLLERGADVNAQTGAGWTALTFAVWKDEAELVRALLSHGAKPNVIDKQGWRPLDYAAPKLAPTDPDLARNPAEPR